jgi:hypothetical protein
MIHYEIRGLSEKLNLKNIKNKNISWCLVKDITENPSDNVLETSVTFFPSYTNSHLFLMQYFEMFFSFMPSFVYFNSQYILYFIPMKRNRMIRTKSSSKKEAFQRKFTKTILFINYDEPITLNRLIKNLFQHVSFQFLEYIKEPNENKISIYCYIKEYQLKFCLGRNGSYIKAINNLMQTYLDHRLTIFIRSVGF